MLCFSILFIVLIVFFFGIVFAVEESLSMFIFLLLQIP